MTLHAAFLRGMNVGGHRITNAELRDEFEALGFESVTTFRASGNVIFEASGQSEGELIAEIESGLEESLGYAVPTFVRDEDELRAIADFDPFDLERRGGVEGQAAGLDARLEAEREGPKARRWRSPPSRTRSRSPSASSTGCRAAGRWTRSSTRALSTSCSGSRRCGPRARSRAWRRSCAGT